MLDAQPQPTFWTRNNFRETDKEIYIQAVATAYPGYTVQEFEYQGQCIHTTAEPWHTDDTTHPLYLDPSSPSPSLIIQIRAPQHALNLSTARAAKAIYPHLAPGIRVLDLGDLPGGCMVYEMQRLRGVPLSSLLPRGGEVDREMQEKMGHVVEGLADVVAQGLGFGRAKTGDGVERRERADSPMQPPSPSPSSPLLPSQISTSIPARLSLLSSYLPTPSLRHHAHLLLQSFTQLTHRHPPYPTVLTHGDLIPSNILVDPRTWRITGLVDWAEAEELPLGMCAYGLEGVVLPRSKRTNHYHYHPFAPHLRTLFWTRLLERVREAQVHVTETELRVIRDVGVLLWYGIAWDGGKLDRVVDAVRDPGEVECLRAFLGVV
ncbi:hypothetical protein IQ07DRAFT_554147 [Pyrenochaeta sp. DS3sAY3a]|nr:hypothetical protein IQ07DRAFT_554147 [Pyrenochaeta sp. DS3sAY3a]